jgi:hypothetical protein
MAPTQHRHVRIDDKTWDKAQRRAIREGTTISAVLREYTVAYAAGKLTRVYLEPAPTEEDSP